MAAPFPDNRCRAAGCVAAATVLIVRVTELPTPVYPTEGTIAIGEGHHAHVMVGEAEVLLDDEEDMFIRVTGQAALKHVVIGTDIQADHLPIDIPVGLYWVLRQRQYNPYDGRSSTVGD